MLKKFPAIGDPGVDKILLLTRTEPVMALDSNGLRVLVRLGFGAEFIPIYQGYPGGEIYAICRRDRKGLDECGDRYGIKTRYTDYRELLKNSSIDAVHINSPIPDHAWMSIEALRAGRTG